jgi:hypothetical protein
LCYPSDIQLSKIANYIESLLRSAFSECRSIDYDERHRLKVAGRFAFSSFVALRNSTGTKFPSPRSKSLQEANWMPAPRKADAGRGKLKDRTKWRTAEARHLLAGTLRPADFVECNDCHLLVFFRSSPCEPFSDCTHVLS